MSKNRRKNRKRRENPFTGENASANAPAPETNVTEEEAGLEHGSESIENDETVIITDTMLNDPETGAEEPEDGEEAEETGNIEELRPRTMKEKIIYGVLAGTAAIVAVTALVCAIPHTPTAIEMALDDPVLYYNSDTENTEQAGIDYKFSSSFLKGYKSKQASKADVNYYVYGDCVTVDEDGLITAVKSGSATVYAEIEEYNLKCSTVVSVYAVPEEIQMDDTIIYLNEYEPTFKFEYTVLPRDFYADAFEITIENSDESVAVLENGMLTMVAPGETEITVTCGDVSASRKVVCQAAPTALSADNITLNAGETAKADVKSNAEGSSVGTDYTYSSDDVTVATTAADGTITAVGAGTATITVINEYGVSTAFTVTVLQAPGSISVNAMSLETGERKTAVVTTDVENANSGITYTYASSDESIMTVDVSGTVTGVKAGTAILTVKNEFGLTATCTVTVSDPDTPEGDPDPTNTEITGNNTTQQSPGEDVWTKMKTYSYVICGDQRVGGFEGYLDTSRLFYEDGAAISSLKHIIPDIAAKNPDKVFLAYGIYDVASGEWTPDEWESDYSVLIEQLHEKLPNARIFVNSILPSSAYTGTEFNKALREMCDNYSYCTYIDNSGLCLAHSDLWASDGTSLKTAFYPYWGENMVEAAESSYVAVNG